MKVDPARSVGLIDTTTAYRAEMGGRQMKAWLRVDRADLGTDEDLEPWVSRAVAHVRVLPPK